MPKRDLHAMGQDNATGLCVPPIDPARKNMPPMSHPPMLPRHVCKARMVRAGDMT